MKSTIAIAALVAGANALVGRSDSCCFQLTASGGETGTLGQLTDGQVRLGDTTLSAAEFCISNSIITDSEGRGCVVTSETTQFQCDEGATGTSGFSLASSGLLSFDSSSSFIACQTGEDNGRNIYTTNSTSVTECISIQLMGDSCGAAASSSVASSPVASTPVAPSPVASSSVPSSVAAVAPTSSVPVPSGVMSSAPVPTPTSSYPLIPTSAAAVSSSTPVIVSTSAVKVTSSSTTASSTTSTSSTTSASASSAASSTAATSGSAITAPMGVAHWVASIAVMLSVMVLY
ncbi:hypothetical protein N7504_011154 [Penicillium tannophilum]|nr:hypothetical protein N7504_011154 [Penicillium tannophilum]